MKHYITPDSLRESSFMLGSKVINDNFIPDFMVSIFRGGGPISICIHELLKYCKIPTDHISIRTSRYTGIDQTMPTVQVHNLGYLVERLNKNSKVLLVDDVLDSGLSLAAVITELNEQLKDNMPTDVRIATVYYKPTRNKTTLVPDYYIHETDEWIVFPHELEGLTIEEISNSFSPNIAKVVSDTLANLK
jgi:hypoxanthine phosphoribosyltransferase